MQERDFLLKLEKRAEEQERLIKKVPMTHAFRYLSLWFGQHPWRIMIPFSLILSLLLRAIFGHNYYEFILWIFGGL